MRAGMINCELTWPGLTYNALVVVLQTATSGLYIIMHRPQCNTDIALTAVLCSIAQVPAAETTTTPHLIGGKTPLL